jgi:hypothetical protein
MLLFGGLLRATRTFSVGLSSVPGVVEDDLYLSIPRLLPRFSWVRSVNGKGHFLISLHH